MSEQKNFFDKNNNKGIINLTFYNGRKESLPNFRHKVAQWPKNIFLYAHLMSKYLVNAWFSDVYQMPLCLRSVSNIEHTVNQSLQEIHQNIKEQVQAAKAIHLNETGHKEYNKNGWAWIMSTLEASYFKLAPSRGKKIVSCHNRRVSGSH